jgi:hypothetical protein
MLGGHVARKEKMRNLYTFWPETVNIRENVDVFMSAKIIVK